MSFDKIVKKVHSSKSSFVKKFKKLKVQRGTKIILLLFYQIRVSIKKNSTLVRYLFFFFLKISSNIIKKIFYLPSNFM